MFCKIARGEIPSHKVDETDEYLAFLDIFPNTKGMTLVIPKKHFNSDVFSMPLQEYNKLMDYAKKVVKKLEKKLNTFRVALVIEGMGVNHAHVKLYPLHGLDSKFKETWHHERVFFEKYPGFITTKLGPEGQDLKKVHEEFTRKR